MCGICGHVSFEPELLPTPDILGLMTDALVHRGPDDRGIWHQDNVGLGHRRLSIIDLSLLGHQPMGNRDKIVFNGEVYNFREIRDELSTHGFSFVSQSDTEVVLKSYKKWGSGSLSKFNGMFAFAIYDRERQLMFLARDRMGVKPLYYYYDQKHFIFASEIKSILKHPAVRKEMNMQALEHFFAFKYIRAPSTIFKNIRQLKPGHFLTVHTKERSIREESYWDLVDKGSPALDASRGEVEYEEELESLIDSSVRYRMISDVPIGALLSGGVDSSLVVASMSRQSGSVKTFSIGFADAKFNEAPYAKKIAEALGTQHEEIYVHPGDVSEALTALSKNYDEPFADPSSIPTYIVSRLARRQVTVVLSGDGGDEMFWGYSRYKKYAMARRFDVIPGPIRKTLFSIIEELPSDVIQKTARGLQYDSHVDCYDYLNGIFKRNDLQKLLTYPLAKRPSLFSPAMTKNGAWNVLYPNLIDLVSYLPDDVLTKVDRSSMAVSLETRAPFLDYRLVTFAMQLPFRFKFKNGQQKYLLKKILKKHLPDTLTDRPKRGFDLPLNAWFRNELRPLLEARLSEHRIKRYGFLSHDFVRSIMQKHFSGRYDYYYMLWTLLSFDLWYSCYIENDESQF